MFLGSLHGHARGRKLYASRKGGRAGRSARYARCRLNNWSLKPQRSNIHPDFCQAMREPGHGRTLDERGRPEIPLNIPHGTDPTYRYHAGILQLQFSAKRLALVLASKGKILTRCRVIRRCLRDGQMPEVANGTWLFVVMWLYRWPAILKRPMRQSTEELSFSLREVNAISPSAFRSVQRCIGRLNKLVGEAFLLKGGAAGADCDKANGSRSVEL